MGAGGGGDLFEFDDVLYHGSRGQPGSVSPRPDARRVQLRLYFEASWQLFTGRYPPRPPVGLAFRFSGSGILIRPTDRSGRRLQFRKRRQLLIGVHNVTFAIIAICVSNEDCLPAGIHG
jgi:hypothetical protein